MGEGEVKGRRAWEDERSGPHVWRTLGYRRLGGDADSASIEWQAGEDYAFPDGAGGSIVHGGLVTTLLDTAMGHACWNGLGNGQSFLTADLHVEFFRPARPGILRAEGRVVHRTRRAVFCAADVADGDGTIVASGRCTQIVRDTPAGAS